MRYCFYIITLLFLIIVQTVILPCFSLFNQFYDLMIPFIIFFGMFRPVRECAAFVILAGLVMDSLSGGYFGLYISIYAWLFFIVKWAVKFLQLQHGAILPLALTTGVLMENFILFVAITMSASSDNTVFSDLSVFVAQLVWAVFTGPFLIIGLNRIYCMWVQFVDGIFIKKDEYNR